MIGDPSERRTFPRSVPVPSNTTSTCAAPDSGAKSPATFRCRAPKPALWFAVTSNGPRGTTTPLAGWPVTLAASPPV